MGPLPKLNKHTRSSFVRGSVKELPITSRIIRAILPYFPRECVCIAGHIDVGGQYWKVNYHWDLLTWKIDDFLASPKVEARFKSMANAIQARLMTNAPDPQSGYRNDAAIGATKDTSSPERILARHTILKQSKRDFESVLKAAKIVDEKLKMNPPQHEKTWWLAVAPVAAPGKSNHGTGYALDIAGNNAETTRISRALGATLVFNEASHVHVEWQRGVPTSI